MACVGVRLTAQLGAADGCGTEAMRCMLCLKDSDNERECDKGSREVPRQLLELPVAMFIVSLVVVVDDARDQRNGHEIN